MPTKPSVGPIEVVRLGVLRLTPPLLVVVVGSWFYLYIVYSYAEPTRGRFAARRNSAVLPLPLPLPTPLPTPLLLPLPTPLPTPLTTPHRLAVENVV
jgi:hypothetical protein